MTTKRNAAYRTTFRTSGLHGSGLIAAAVAACSLASGSAHSQNAVLVPGCEGILTPATLEELKAKTVDPEVEFENWRNQHPNAMEASPVVHCRHLAWLALHPKPGAASAGATEAELEGSISPLAATVGANIDVPTGVATDSFQGEVQLAVNPNNPLQMVAGANTWYRDPACVSPTGGTANTYGTLAYYGSTDGGATWVYQCAPWPASLTGGTTGAVAWFGSDPAATWDNAGNTYASYMLCSQNNTGANNGCAIVVSKSANAGATWTYVSAPVNRLTATTNLDDKNMMAIDRTVGQAHSHQNRMFVIWDEGNVERVAWADPPGYTPWSTVIVGTGTEIGGNLAVGSDGTVYAVWNRYGLNGGVGAGDRRRFRKSTDGGVTWSAVLNLPTGNLGSFGTTGCTGATPGNHCPPAQNVRGVNAFVSIDIDNNAASPFFGRLYLVYTDYPTGVASGTDLNTYLVRSTDGGATWSTQVKVNSDAGTATQFFPWMSVDQSDGTVNVSWYDTRTDATNNRRAQVYYARSTDGGVTFEPEFLITDAGANFVNKINYCDENSTDNTNYNPNQYGDYSGMAAVNRRAYAFWTDTREYFTPTVDTRREDPAISAITNCSAPGVPGTPALSCSGSAIVVSWSAPGAWGTNATGGTYNVERFTDSACTLGKTVVATGLATTSYTDATGTPGTTYYYHVVAKNNCPGTSLTPMSSVSSCSSGLACTACSQAAPTSPAVSATGDGQNTLTWTAASGAVSYNVYRIAGTCPATFGAALATGVAGSPYIDNAAVPGTTYAYAVTAVNGCESAKSSCVNVSTRGTYSSGRFANGRPQDTTTAGLPVRWIYSTPATALTPPAVNAAVFAVSNDRFFHSMVAGQTSAGSVGGAGAWPTSPSTFTPAPMNAPAQSRPPVVATSVIPGHSKLAFVGAQDGRVYCLDANSGALVWASAVLGDYLQGSANGMFTVFGGTWDLILVGTRNATLPNTIYALNVSNGSTAWSFNNGGGANAIGIVNSGVQVDYPNKRFYFTSRKFSGGSANTVWCLSFTNASASLLWASSLPANIDGAASLLNGRLYAGDNASQVWAFDATSGATLWSGPFACSDGPVKAFITPDFGSTNLYLSTSGKVWSLNDGGSSVTQNWVVSSIANPSAVLFLRGLNQALVGSSDGKLYQISTASPATIKSVQIGAGNAQVGSPTADVVNTMVYAGTAAGDVYAATVPLP